MSPKLRSCLTYTVAAVGVVALAGWLLYHGARWSYYQGWWGRDNPVARYLWLCDAPPDFEQTLYPANVEILVPACENLVRVSHRPTYFTSDKQYLHVDHYLEGGYWLEIATGKITTTRPLHVQYATGWQRESGERVDWWFNLDSREVITTSPGSVVTLAECGMDYDFWEGLFSPDGRWIARFDGIYDAASGENLLDYGLGYVPGQGQTLSSFYPCAWLPDNQGLILTPGSVWGLELLIFSQYGEYLPGTNYPVPQPVLKFTLPEAYR